MSQQQCIKEFSVYGSYHTSFLNKVIHVICVPLILGSAFGLFELLWAVQIPTPFPWPIAPFRFHLGWLILLHLPIPISCDLPAGAVTAGWQLILLVAASRMVDLLGASAWILFVGLQVGCWTAQFVGHALENKRPALLDNVLLMFSAHFFVVLEVLFACGYKPELREACEGAAKERAKQA